MESAYLSVQGGLDVLLLAEAGGTAAQVEHEGEDRRAVALSEQAVVEEEPWRLTGAVAQLDLNVEEDSLAWRLPSAGRGHQVNAQCTAMRAARENLRGAEFERRRFAVEPLRELRVGQLDEL